MHIYIEYIIYLTYEIVYIFNDIDNGKRIYSEKRDMHIIMLCFSCLALIRIEWLNSNNFNISLLHEKSSPV